MGQMWSHGTAGVPMAPLCIQALQELILVVISFY